MKQELHDNIMRLPKSKSQFDVNMGIRLLVANKTSYYEFKKYINRTAEKLFAYPTQDSISYQINSTWGIIIFPSGDIRKIMLADIEHLKRIGYEFIKLNLNYGKDEKTDDGGL